jgi:hypothetical protein
MAISFDPTTGLPTTKKTKAAAATPFSPMYANTMPADGGGGWTPPPTPGPWDSPGSTPNYTDLINSNPEYLKTLGDLNTQGIQSKAQRALARQRAIIGFGSSPDFGKAGMDLGLVGGDIQGDITPETIAAAAANNEAGLSTTARLGSAHAKASRDLLNALGARGLARSGETGFQLDQENQNYAIGQNDATGKLLDYLAGVQSAFTQGEADRANARNVAAGIAGQTVATQYPATGSEHLTWNSNADAYGPDSNGNYYDANHKITRPGEFWSTPTSSVNYSNYNSGNAPTKLTVGGRVYHKDPTTGKWVANPGQAVDPYQAGADMGPDYG